MHEETAGDLQEKSIGASRQMQRTQRGLAEIEAATKISSTETAEHIFLRSKLDQSVNDGKKSIQKAHEIEIAAAAAVM